MKKGFTLIELLVVVLIIGILSAIALPQYTKAVEKARLAEVPVMLSSLQRAMNIYLLENTPTDFANFLGKTAYNATDGLVIDLENLDCSGTSCNSKYFKYTAYYDYEFRIYHVAAERYNGNPHYTITWRMHRDGAIMEKSCNPTNQAGQDVCNLFIPEGYTVTNWL